MAKKSNKNKAKNTKNKNNAKQNNKPVQPKGMSEQEQNEIIAQTQALIEKLRATKKNIFKKEEKELATKQADDLQKLLDDKQYYVLKNNLESLKKLEEDEKKKIEAEKQAEVKEKKPKLTFKQRMAKIKEFDRWPLYSRTKRILENDEGSVKIQKLCLLYGALVILLGVVIVGLLLLVQVIPNEWMDGSTNNYIPALIFAIPLALIFAL